VIFLVIIIASSPLQWIDAVDCAAGRAAVCGKPLCSKCTKDSLFEQSGFIKKEGHLNRNWKFFTRAVQIND